MPLHRSCKRTLAAALLVAGLFCVSVPAMAQNAPQGVPENMTRQVSPHVFAIVGFPNIAMVFGDRATLVVDTGLGARNGAVIVREVQKLAKTPNLYLTTTHFHPEHSSGEQAFPSNTIIIRNAAQQDELDKHGAEFVALFAGRSSENRELLTNVKLRHPDIVFDSEAKIDLGGVTVRLFSLGPAHTTGDEIIFVEEDSVLIPGDIVQSKMIPNMPGENASLKNWIAILDKLEPLKPRFIVPDHGELGDGSLIAKERAFLVDLQTRARELKRKGTGVDDAATTIAAELKAKYPDWTGGGVPNDVRRAYAEAQ